MCHSHCEDGVNHCRIAFSPRSNYGWVTGGYKSETKGTIITKYVMGLSKAPRLRRWTQQKGAFCLPATMEYSLLPRTCLLSGGSQIQAVPTFWLHLSWLGETKVFPALKVIEEQRQRYSWSLGTLYSQCWEGFHWIDSCHVDVILGQERLGNMPFLCAIKEEVHLSGSDINYLLSIQLIDQQLVQNMREDNTLNNENSGSILSMIQNKLSSEIRTLQT